jgi:nucleoside-diphosphate-sugar epimerase
MLDPIMVTGAAGFVGKYITSLLRSQGIEVVTHARTAAPGIDWVADFGDPSVMSDQIPCNVAGVVHCAAAIPTRSSAFARDNTAAAIHLASLLADARSIKRVIHLSSIAVYERPVQGQWIISEDDAQVVDVSDSGNDAYACSKRCGELALDAIASQRSDIKTTHLRASSIYGLGMVTTTLLPALVRHAQRGEPLRLHGPKSYTQNFVHIKDVADLVAALVRDDCAPSVVNGFSDDTYSVPALAELIRVRLGSASQIVDETQDIEVPEPVFVNARAKRLHAPFRRLADHLLDAA